MGAQKHPMGAHSGFFALDGTNTHGSIKAHPPKRRTRASHTTAPYTAFTTSQPHNHMSPHCTNTPKQAIHGWFGAALVIGLTLSLLAAPGNADAKQAKRSKTGTSESAKKKGVTKVTYQRSSSEESRSERDRRMYRECKGMHNAGACLGYTRR